MEPYLPHLKIEKPGRFDFRGQGLGGSRAFVVAPGSSTRVGPWLHGWLHGIS